MYQNIIFIGGIHGVGKGNVCTKIQQKMDLEHLSASEVLKWSEVSPDTSNKLVKDISDTQDRLINRLKSLINPNKRYILDGHFCLFDAFGKIHKIPLTTFEKISPFVISVVTSDVEIVNERLRKRDGKSYSQNILNEMQETEIDQAVSIANSLNIPFFIIKNDDSSELVKFLSN
ncbi:ATP-binding protein [Fulvivirgaceae bacterium BMA10]|uniref:ATP-binding protein n=1 Tax=Splendidivirga corallicola TaxID=3051826 RepID=A0ABT8KMJ3_9BACT|nr:ATP-binding protein [Fulvivirgaceae bacterium BMA10]